MAYDILIKNGTVVDGTGMPRCRADVGIKDGRIVERGRLGGAAGRTIDATGLVVAPGFIDMHTHYDVQLAWDPLATSSCWHGVTTVLIGNCGFGIAPGRASDADYLMRLMARVEGMQLDVLRAGLDWTWESFGEFLDGLARGLGVNVAAQVGHCPLRYYVMGEASYQRPSTDDELKEMKAILREAMTRGAAGFSSDQTSNHVGAYGEPVPSRMGAWDELIELAGVVGEFNHGVVGLNPHPGGGDITPEFRETMKQMSFASGRPVLWNSLMHRWDQPSVYRGLIDFMAEAASEGAQIYAMGRTQRMDLEFNFRFTAMFDLFPAWREVLAQPHEQKKRMMGDEEVRRRLREEWDARISRMSSRQPRFLEVARTVLPKNKSMAGRKLVDLQRETGKHIVDLLLDVSLEEDLQTQFMYVGTMNGDEEAVAQIVTSPYSVPGVSDAGAHVDMDCGVDFSDVLLGKWVRQRGVLSLEQAVNRLTFFSASLLGLTDRGLIREGMAADVVVFDAETIGPGEREMVADLPGGGRRLVQRSDAVRTVIVNGQVLLQEGRHTGDLPGRIVSGGTRRANGA